MSGDHSEHAPELPHVHIVLARPSEPRNIGAACRAIKNFGIHRLTIVTSRPIDYDAARPLAVGAVDLLEQAAVVTSLPEALTGASLVAGTTRRLGQKRKAAPLMPWELASTVAARYAAAQAHRAPPNGGAGDAPSDAAPHGAPGDAAGAARGDATEAAAEVAVVFGNEQSGLSDEELLECHVAVAIPTSPACPSLNLSHAVEVIAYELSIAQAGGRNAGPGAAGSAGPAPAVPGPVPGPITTPEIAAQADEIIASLEELSFHSQAGPQGMRTFIRDLIARAGLSHEEAQRFTALFAKLAGMHGHQ